MSAVEKIPIEVWGIILEHVPPSPLIPVKDDDLINNLKLLSDDCEAAVACAQYRAGLRTLCKKWDTAVKFTHPFLLLPGHTSTWPSAFRVQFPTTCECRLQGCPMVKPPPLSSYKTRTQPMQAFLDASPVSDRSVEDIIREHKRLWLLSIAVDFSSFSLPTLSVTCRRLTHLSFSEFHLPDSDQDQTLDLPLLNTLVLNFFNLGDTIPPPMQPTPVHRSYQRWRLPKLRNLSLKGWISDASPDFLDQINSILPIVGPTLQGLLYKLWSRSDTRDCILYPLPPSLWDWCPRLHTIQSPLKILLAAPKPPPSHPRLTFVPVHLGDLETLPDNMSNLVWSEDLLQNVQNGNPWPIDIIRISTTWATFHRKLQGMHERGANPNPQGQENGALTNWPRYFGNWFDVLLSKGHALQDRSGVNIREGDGLLLVEWLRSIEEWYFVPREVQ